jgi:2-polyprenyl-6-methoxyphenol hydroxylase-like FAD-dependent oxidoreductase
VDVYVFERGDEVRGFAGSGLTIWTNALAALDRIGLADRVAEHGIALARQEIRTRAGDLLGVVEVGRIGASIGRPGVGVRRQDLLRTLHEACGDVPIRFRAQLSSVHQDDDGVTAVFADGREERGDVLVGADGIRSAVRETVFADGPPTALGHMIWRGISESDVGYPDATALMFFGDAGARSVSWPVGGGRVCWSISLNGGPARTPLRDPHAVRRMLLDLVADFPLPLRSIVRATPAERVMRTDLYGRLPQAWQTGRVALVGDASHAMPTVYGQGACQAIEDAVVLAECLSDGPGLARYEERRADRVRWIAGRVFGLSRFQEWELPVLTAVRNSAFRRIPPQVTEQTWRTLLTFEGDGRAA